MKKRLMNIPSIAILLVCMLISACSNVKDLTNVNLWPFGKGEPSRVYQPANSTPYMCEGNKKFFVRILDKGASAWLIMPDREVLLAQAGASKVYTNGVSKVDLTSDDVTLVVNETTKYAACKANGVAKVTKIEPVPMVEPVAIPAKQEPTPVVVEAPAPKVAEVKADAVVVPVTNESVQQAVVPADDHSASQEAVTKTLDAWANAWRTKNTEAYLNTYSAKFKPEGMSKKSWVEQRKQRVGANPADITLSLDKVNIVADAKKAEVSFVQHYASGKYSDTVAKVLSLENDAGHWVIVKETSKSQK